MTAILGYTFSKETTMKRIILLSILLCTSKIATHAQVDEDNLGAWYMYFWNTSLNDSKLGLQGDVQLRNWSVASDLEQLLLRGGLTYQATEDALLTAGYAHITTGTYGDSDVTSTESRIYQEALLSHTVSNSVKLRHRFRYEQRWVDGQDFRTRYRYNLFLTIPLSSQVYLSFYNELFVNGQKDIGDGRSVQLFDRNRLYGAVGYKLSAKHNIQLGMMRQTTNTWTKQQLQFSLHSNW